MKRHTITLGAPTSAGGKVIAASGNGSINGAPIALEDDIIFCPACKSQGKIKCVGPRIPETCNGKNVALENDLCLCSCSSAPYLLQCQSLKFQFIGETASPSPPDAGVFSSTEILFDDQYILIDDETGTPLARIEFALKRANGLLEFGITDEQGHTHLLASTAHSEPIEIYL